MLSSETKTVSGVETTEGDGGVKGEEKRRRMTTTRTQQTAIDQLQWTGGIIGGPLFYSILPAQISAVWSGLVIG